MNGGSLGSRTARDNTPVGNTMSLRGKKHQEAQEHLKVGVVEVISKNTMDQRSNSISASEHLKLPNRSSSFDWRRPSRSYHKSVQEMREVADYVVDKFKPYNRRSGEASMALEVDESTFLSQPTEEEKPAEIK